MSALQLIFEVVLFDRESTPQRHQYVSRSDGAGYWHLVLNRENGSWHVTRRERVAAMAITVNQIVTTQLVECPLCGRSGLPERIMNHDCESELGDDAKR